MSGRSYLPKFAVSLYVFFFLFAIWSAIATPFGSATIASGAMEPRLAQYELFSGTD